MKASDHGTLDSKDEVRLDGFSPTHDTRIRLGLVDDHMRVLAYDVMEVHLKGDDKELAGGEGGGEGFKERVAIAWNASLSV